MSIMNKHRLFSSFINCKSLFRQNLKVILPLLYIILVFCSYMKKEVSKDLFFYFYSPLHFIENGKQAPQA